RGPGGKYRLSGRPDLRIAAAEALQHPRELDGTSQVGAEQARAPLVEDEGNRALAAGQGVGVGGLARGAGPEDDMERGWYGAHFFPQSSGAPWRSCSPAARTTAQLDLCSRQIQRGRQQPGPRPTLGD